MLQGGVDLLPHDVLFSIAVKVVEEYVSELLRVG